MAMEPTLGECHDVLKSALSADEEGRVEVALDLYTKFVELSLKVSNPADKHKVQPMASQALDRAEDLKRALSRDKQPDTAHNESTVSLGLPAVQPEGHESPLTLPGGAPLNYSPDEIR